MKIGTLIASVGILGIAALVVVPNYIEMVHRTKVSYSREAQRAVAVAFYRSETTPTLLQQVYWGPLTPSMLASMEIAIESVVDPYNRSDDPAEWRKGPKVTDVDRGATVKVEGRDFQFFSDGKGFWMIIGAGPDGTISITEDLSRAGRIEFLSRSPNEYVVPSIVNHTYDPTNGTKSSGDIWRVSLQ